jgi:glycosyl transferase family 25
MTRVLKEIDSLLDQYFDKVLVMTVPRFKERQEKVKERLKGISFEFFYGVDKNDLTDAFIQGNYVYDKKNSLAITQQIKPLNKGEIACSLSHRSIYRAMLENNWQRVLIFEDDVVPDPELLPALIDCLRELPSDWELFYLGYLKNEKPGFGNRLKQSWYKIQSRIGLTRMPYSMVKNRLPKPFSSSLMKAGFHDCTHAYAVSQEGAKKLLKTQTPVIYRADNLLSALILKNSLKAFISRACLFNQEIAFDIKSKSYIRTDPALNTE